MKKIILLLTTSVLCLQAAFAQQRQTIIINDFENKPATDSWWRDNKNVKFVYDEAKTHQVNKQSTTCLFVRWDSTQAAKPFTWFTDLKADTMAAEGMESTWKLFGPNTWLSFWCRVGKGDSLMLHYLVLSKGHSSKWGAKTMLPVASKKWTFYKVRFADIQYDDWGKIVAPFDLNSDTGRCFEVGLRSGSVSTKGFIEAWFDNIKLTNYEPFD